MNTPGSKRSIEFVSPEADRVSPTHKSQHIDSDSAKADKMASGLEECPVWFKIFNEQLDKRLAYIETQLGVRLDGIEQRLEVLEGRLLEAKEEMDTTASKQKLLTKDNEDLRKKLNTLEDKLDTQENYSRKLNLRLDGVKEGDGEDTAAETEKTVRQLLAERIPEAQNVTMEACHRVGKVRPRNRTGGSEDTENSQAGRVRPRSIIIRFRYLQERQKVWERKKNFKGSDIYVNEDFSQRTDKRRKQLIPAMKLARKDGQVSYLKGETLIIAGKSFWIDNIPPKYKSS